MSEKLLTLPDSMPSETDISQFIDQQVPFVDKTGMIRNLLLSRGPYFLARPRRFGKTLLLDTIENIAMGNKKLFKNTDIMKAIPKYDWKTLPVIYIDMSDVSPNPDHFEKSLTDTLISHASHHQVEVDKSSTPSGIFTQLILQLSLRHDPYIKPSRHLTNTNNRQNVVILIDEYDYPLTSNIGNNVKIEIIRAGLRNFYSAIKKNRYFYRFVFITGVTNFFHMSPLSGLNNVTDITFNDNYSSICGFTKTEIIKTFKKYLPYTLQNMKSHNIMDKKSTTDDLIKNIEDWYDGYTWNGNTKVLNPYSVINCLIHGRFDDYWFKSGTSIFIHRLGLNNNSYFNLFMKDRSIIERSPEISLDHHASILTTNDLLHENEVLLQAGYLTIDKIDHAVSPRDFFLKIPNNEIKNSIIRQFIQRLSVPICFSNRVKYWNDRYQNFYDSFCSLNHEKSEELLSSVITSIPFYYALREESIFYVLLFFCLNIGKHRPISEQAVIKCRSDLVIKTPNNDWIIVEVKHFKPNNNQNFNNSIAENTDQIQKSVDNQILSSSSPISISANEKNSNGLDYIPIFDTAILEAGPKTLSSQGDRILDILIKNAFKQITKNKYAVPYLGGKEKVYAAAVAIYDSTFVRIRFKRVVWKT
jgi:hypothetical protein